MARPKNNQEGAPESNSEAILPPTERENARETVSQEVVQAPVYVPPPVYTPPQPRQMRIERQGALSEPYVRHYPEVRGGVCDFCGILDPNVPSQFQYKLCQHYRGMQLMCSYCPSSKDQNDVIYKSRLLVMDSPDRPGELIVVCDNYECERAHQQRFRRAQS